jgi:hypothetical protein
MRTRTRFHPAFPPVPSHYGARMGRRAVDPGGPVGRIHLARIRWTDGDYDEGGVYWGRYGADVWAAWSRSGFRRYFRAASRREALQILGEIKRNETERAV